MIIAVRFHDYYQTHIQLFNIWKLLKHVAMCILEVKNHCEVWLNTQRITSEQQKKGLIFIISQHIF